ncbi:MAG TPA: hypothetical protein HPP76_02070 [Desulfuromonadales bacterium]|nr:hypothetical protein [Desulfuromonadales bacterium]
MDTTWRGTVLVRGSVIVAPQATLRIEPGTIVRFSSEDAKNMPSRLVVQGRIQAVGTADKRIMMTSERPDGWGGVLLHATEKRNQLEQCSIEHASVAVGMQYSVLALKNCSLTHARVGILSRDSFVQLSGGSISGGGIGIELHDSELEARDTAISSCRQGVVAFRSSVALTSVRISGSEQFGFTADECRIRLTSSELSSNGTGARIKGGSGQISMGSFVKNRVVALHLSGARLKINRCSFSETGGDAVRFEDGQALVWDSAFSANAGYNIYNAGSDDVHAIQNWWGSSDRSGIVGKIFDRARNTGSGVVHYSPWATAKPALAP